LDRAKVRWRWSRIADTTVLSVTEDRFRIPRADWIGSPTMLESTAVGARSESDRVELFAIHTPPRVCTEKSKMLSYRD